MPTRRSKALGHDQLGQETRWHIGHERAVRNGNTISVAMLARGIVDYVPPVFEHENFAQVASQSPRSIRGSLQQIEQALRHIADSALHMHIRARETVPTPTQVDFRQSFDVLLGGVIRRQS